MYHFNKIINIFLQKLTQNENSVGNLWASQKSPEQVGPVVEGQSENDPAFGDTIFVLQPSVYNLHQQIVRQGILRTLKISKW